VGTFLVASLLMTVLFPRLSRLLRNPSEKATAFVESLLKNVLLAMTLGALVVWSRASWLLRGLFGQALASADDVLRILAPALPFVFVNVILFHVFVAARRRKAYLGTLMLSLTLGALGGLVLAPRYGATGSAIAALVREFITTLVFLCFLRREQVAPQIGRALLRMLAGATGVAAVLSGLAYALVHWTAWPLAWTLLVLGGTIAAGGLPNREQWMLLADEER
jgi:O-antigen/teichoic acid export membrane protein